MIPDDERFLRHAIALAKASRDEGQAPYGSLLVGPDGRVLAEDHNTVLADGDDEPTGSADLEAGTEEDEYPGADGGER